MRRFLGRSLAVRLSLAMLAVSFTVLTLVVLLESLIFFRELSQLPPVMRQPFFGTEQTLEERPFLDQLPDNVRQAYLYRVEQFQSAFKNFRRARQRSIVLSAFLALGLATLLALVLARRISKPLAAVSRAANEMKQGQLSARVDLSTLHNADEETLALSQSFNAMAETLEKNELERKNMIADIAHELRTPLAVMQARLAAMQDEIIPLNNAEIEKVYNQTQLLSRLITDLRTLSLAEAGRLSFNRQKVDVKKLLEQVISSFEATAKIKDIEIVLGANETTFVTADADRLTQVISNLLDNALRYTPAGKEIRVNLAVEDQQVRLELHDSGPGLSEEALAKAFDRFYKADERSGSGLGLAIVKTLVELHAGSVAVKNGSTGGAIFSVVLPRGL